MTRFLLRCGLAALAIAQAAGAQSNTCASAPPLPTGSFSGTTVGSTLDGSSACTARTGDVWFRYTAPANGTLVLNTACATSVGVSVHTACPGTAANQIACNYRHSYCDAATIYTSSYLEVPVAAGVQYIIRIFGNSAGFTMTPYFIAPRDAGGIGPDLVSGNIPEISRHPASNGYYGYSLGSTACNIGTDNIDWITANNSNRHPVISGSIYRLKAGRFEQLGYSWLKHGFASGTETWCNYCPHSDVLDHLLPGCSDSYTAFQNGDQGDVGARSQVNPTTGVFPYPPIPSGTVTDASSKRIRVPFSSVDPAQNAGAQYFAELHYLTADDCLFGNGLNNVSHRRLTFSGTAVPTLTGITQRSRPAILAWAELDPEVTVIPVDFTDNNYPCRFWVASKAHNNGDGTWTYTYAIDNLNANRAASSLRLPRQVGVTTSAPGFSAPLSHSGEPYSNTAWAWSEDNDSLGWATTQTYAQNVNANAVRWGTTYTMWFTSTRPPTAGIGQLGLFMPGGPGEPTQLAVAVPIPSAPPCAADFNADGFVDFFDIDAFVECFDAGNCPEGKTADFNGDGFTDFFDLDAYVTAFEAGC